MEARIVQIVIPIDFTQFYTTLIHHGIVKPKMEKMTFYIPPGHTVDFTVYTPKDYYFLFVENAVAIKPDNALEVKIYIDDELLHHDPDVVQNLYNEAINFPRRFGAIKGVKRSWRIVLRNNSTTDIVQFHAWASYGIIKAEHYERIYSKFFETLAITLRLPPYG
jgi:hypothetical protein